MRRACWIFGAAGLLVVVLAMLGAALAFRGGISARPAPSAVEARVARMLRRWIIPGDARDTTNPVPPSARVLQAGLAHFADHCASCHANDGSGQTDLGRGLYPRPPDLRARETQELTDGELFYIIQNGVRLTGMPAWESEEGAHESWELVHFIRHLPRLTAEQRVEMEALNPRPPQEWRALEEEDAFLRGGSAPPEPGSGAHPH